MSELPVIAHGAAPLDGCHRTHSGVAIHVMPDCACSGPTQMLDVHDAQGQVVGQHAVKVANHVNVMGTDGKSTSISLEQARNAGYIN
ncbi:MAG TPA: hypothetical protein VGH54_23910 [Mycobacterium sp.]|jgi:hypothetical protein|uniref:hypothetical protein n=1 Tax=Mycobacterium sp. TaxID=1785 RepID=UPI002F40D770